MECIRQSARPTTVAVKLVKWLPVAAALMFSTACSVFGVESVEEAQYTSVLKDDQFEIRDYAPFVVAEARVTSDYKKAGNTAFRQLFRYISGDNEANSKIAMTAPVISETSSTDTSEKIAMTAPVISEQEGEAWVYRFVLPKQYTIDTAPRPLNPEVTLAEIPSQRVATIRYSGRATEQSRAKNTEALVSWIEAEGLVALSEPRWAGYNSPWAIPATRRNEVLIDIETP